MFEFLLTNITYLFVYVYAKCGKEWATGNDQNHLTAVCVSIYDKNFLKATLGLILILVLNTPGTRGGPGGHDRMLAIKSKNKLGLLGHTQVKL